MSPDSSKARIFISHSAKEQQAQDVREALVAALKASARADGFAILLDKIALEPGDMWRARINLWVGGCDAAVILLSKAALESAYVAYEASILSYRAAMGDSLLLLPILLDEVTPQDLGKGRLSPAQLAELQAIDGKGKTAQDIAREVVAKLEAYVPPGGTPLERRADYLIKRLRDFTTDELSDAAKAVALNIEEWIPFAEEKARLRLAVQLLSVGFPQAIPALLRLRGHLSPGLSNEEKTTWLQEMVDCVASAWVDPRSIQRLPEVARGRGLTAAQKEVLGVAVNASKPLTGWMYFLCASTLSGDPEGTWHWGDCLGLTGEDHTSQVIDRLSGQVMNALSKFLKQLQVPPTLEALREVLEDVGPYHRILVALPGDGMTDEILQALRGQFPHVTFFLLLGEGEELETQLFQETIELLFPTLGLGEEDKLSKQYKTSRNILLFG